jgi:hypothetical protein
MQSAITHAPCTGRIVKCSICESFKSSRRNSIVFVLCSAAHLFIFSPYVRLDPKMVNSLKKDNPSQAEIELTEFSRATSGV